MFDDQQTLTMLTVFSGLVALAIIVLAGCVVAICLEIRRLSARANEFMDRWQPVADSAEQTIEEFSAQSGQLLSRLNEIAALLHKQTLQADSLINDLVATSQRSVEDVDRTVQKALATIHSTVEAFDQAVRLPSQKLKAIVAGLSAALRHLAAGRAKDPGRISTDEEMFI